MTEQKTVLVTGAAGALGEAVLADLTSEGWRVVALARERSLARLDPATHALALSVDLLDAAAVRASIDEVARRMGRLDALLCLAGGYFGGASVADTPPERLEEQLRLNLMTAYNPIHAVLPHFLEAGGGAIVAVSSRPAIEAARGATAYAIAKLGVLKLIEQVSTEYRRQGIRANVIVPATIDTPENREAMPDADFDRWVPPARIAAVLRFLIGEDAAVISGATIPVYGRG